jgi:hypothetical protein
VTSYAQVVNAIVFGSAYVTAETLFAEQQDRYKPAEHSVRFVRPPPKVSVDHKPQPRSEHTTGIKSNGMLENGKSTSICRNSTHQTYSCDKIKNAH